MIISGYKFNANFASAQKSLTKHLGMSAAAAKSMVEDIRGGKGIRVTDDFVLREDLEDSGFIVE